MEVVEAWEHSSHEERDVTKEGRACSWFSRSWISLLSSRLGVSGTDSGRCRQLRLTVVCIWASPLLHPPNVTHMMNAPRPSLVFTALPLHSIIVDANW